MATELTVYVGRTDDDATLVKFRLSAAAEKAVSGALMVRRAA